MTEGKSASKRVLLVLLTAVLLAGAAVNLTAGGTMETETGPAAAGQEAAVQEDISIVTAVLRGPSGFAAAKLLEDNFQPGHGVSAEYIIVGSPIEVVAKMTSGEIDAAFLPVNLAAKLYSKGPGYRLAAVSGVGSLYMVSSDESIKDWGDLKGKKIYLTGKGATPDYLLRYLLMKNGLDPENDVELDFTVQAPQIAQLMIADRAETAFIPQPFALQVELNSDASVALDPQKELMRIRGGNRPFPFTAFVLSPRLTESRPEAAAALTAALEGSIAWVKANPATAAAAIEEAGIMGAAVAESAIPVSGIEFIPAVEAKAEVEDFLTMLLELDPVSIGGALPDEGFYLED